MYTQKLWFTNYGLGPQADPSVVLEVIRHMRMLKAKAVFFVIVHHTHSIGSIKSVLREQFFVTTNLRVTKTVHYQLTIFF